MQRRAAAIYVALFLVIGVASYTLIATAQTPTVTFENPDYELSQGSQFELDGQTYTVSSLTAEVEGGEHGAPETLSRTGEISWTNQSSEWTETWDNNSTVTVSDTPYTVLIPNESDPTTVTLREDLNESQILQDDSNADNETVTRNGQPQVVVQENGETRLVPADEYFPEPSTRQFEENQQFEYNGNQTTVTAVDPGSVTLTWTAPRTQSVSLSDQSNVTVGGQNYLAFFPDNQTVMLTQDYQSYNAQTQDIESFDKHVVGLWGIIIVSGLASFLLLAMAYLPSRY
ncbi:MAG: hypothetical protein ACQETI_06985 [Halobacteriota archaeon]